jgi:RHS repeat-associated protein
MLGDHLKSTSALVARNGVLNVKYFYYPYGARRGVPFNTITARHFTGQYHETSLPGGEGLSFFNARWYDPKLGSFLSADSIVPAPLAPQSLNRYAYVGGNPVNHRDPTGHACDDGPQTYAACYGNKPVSHAVMRAANTPGGRGTVTYSDIRRGLPNGGRNAPYVAQAGQTKKQVARSMENNAISSKDTWVNLGFDWLLQWGPATRFFYEGSWMAEQLKHHPGVEAARSAFLRQVRRPNEEVPYTHDFGPDGYIQAWRDLDEVGHFLGTYDVYIRHNGQGMMIIRVENQTDLASFSNLRSSPVDVSMVEQLQIGNPLVIDGQLQFKTILPDLPRDVTPLGGNYRQFYVWAEEIP